MYTQRIVLFFLLSIILPCVSIAQTAPLKANDIQLQLKKLDNKKLSESEKNEIKANLEQALQFISQYDDFETKLTNYKKQIEKAPKDTEEYKNQLNKLLNTPKKDIPTLTKSMSDSDLQKYASDNESTLSTLQNTLTDITTSLLKAQTRPEQIQSQIASLQARQQEIGNELSNTSATNTLTTEYTTKLHAEQQAITAHNALLQLELSQGNVLQELNNQHKNLINTQIERIKEENVQLQQILSDRRLTATEQTIKDTTQSNNLTNSLLQKENQINIDLSQLLLEATKKNNALSENNTTVNAQLDAIKLIEESLPQQIKALHGNVYLFEVLNQQRSQLPTVSSDTSLTDTIGQYRLYQFKLNRARANFGNPLTYVDKIAPKDSVDEATRQTLLDIANKRNDLYKQLQQVLTNLTNLSVNLQISHNQLLTKTTQITKTIDQQMFWTPSTPPLNIQWFKDAPSNFKQEMQATDWTSSIKNMFKALLTRPWLFLPLLLIIVFLFAKRKAMSEYISQLHRDVGNVKKDTQFTTPLVVLLNILFTLPITLAFALAGISLLFDDQGHNYAYGMAFIDVSIGIMVFYTSYRMLSPNSLAIIHFRWNAEQTVKLRHRIVQLGTVSILTTAIVTIASNQLQNISTDVIGVSILIICYLCLSYLLFKTLLSKEVRPRQTHLRYLLSLALTITPIILMIACTMGYYYTALKLTDRLTTTVYALVVYTLVEGMAMRWLQVAARRLAYQRAIEKRQKALMQAKEQEHNTASMEEEMVVEEPALDMETINQQTLKILQMSLLTALAFILYYIWADVLAVFTYLNNITLYTYLDVDNTTLVPLTLMGFIAAVIIFGMTVVLVRNLPGLLEMLILSKLNISRGSSYAITTIFSYIIIGIGTSLTLGILGLNWGKLQWLVAALSVGLGFGLQEIFANFVSGIILLFERPIRIGDRITIGGVTGTVNRIQIRATRMTDTDRKEVIIPNKTFVTSQLTNWTLTDTISKIAIKIGVSYDSDIEKVKSLLLQIANEHPKIIKDPAPGIWFTEFAADSLNVEMSILVNEIADRTSTLDDINRKILTVFRQENIDMPFHQVDITLKNREGRELQLK